MTYRFTTSQKAYSLYSKPDDIGQSSVSLLPCNAVNALFDGDDTVAVTDFNDVPVTTQSEGILKVFSGFGLAGCDEDDETIEQLEQIDITPDPSASIFSKLLVANQAMMRLPDSRLWAFCLGFEISENVRPALLKLATLTGKAYDDAVLELSQIDVVNVASASHAGKTLSVAALHNATYAPDTNTYLVDGVHLALQCAVNL